MTWDHIERDWSQYKGSVKRQWCKLTNLDVFTGERERLVLHIQERYDMSKDEAEKQLADWQGQWKITST